MINLCWIIFSSFNCSLYSGLVLYVCMFRKPLLSNWGVWTMMPLEIRRKAVTLWRTLNHLKSNMLQYLCNWMKPMNRYSSPFRNLHFSVFGFIKRKTLNDFFSGVRFLLLYIAWDNATHIKETLRMDGLGQAPILLMALVVDFVLRVLVVKLVSRDRMLME